MFVSLIFVLKIVFKEKPKNRLINFVFIYWFLTFNFYKSIVMWRLIPRIWHLRKADFMFAWFLTGMFLLAFFSNVKWKNPIKRKQPLYEKFLFAYLIFVILMYGLHYSLGNITAYKATQFSRLYLEALLIYLAVRHFVSKELIRMLLKAIVYLAIISSIASIVQFFIDTRFLRVGFLHFAYPGHNRSSGLFFYPYDNGIFQILAVYTVAYFFKDKYIRAILITLFVFSLYLVFTRGTWIAFVAVSIFHLYYYYRASLRKIIFLGGIFVFLLSLAYGAYRVQKDILEGGYKQRVTSDTVSVRLAFYGFVLEAIPKKWLIGYGDVENNEVYFKGMVNAEQSLSWALGRRGGVHNLFLEEAFLRGIFSPLILIFLFFSFFKFSVKQSIEDNNFFYCIINYFTFGFFLYFNSVSGFLLSRTGFLCIPMFAIVSGIYYKKLDISDILPKRDVRAQMKKNKFMPEGIDI